MIDALFDLLGAFYQDGNLAQAESIARSILQAIPDDIISLQFLGLLYYRTNRRSEAMQAFGAAATDRPGEPAADDDEGHLRASAQCLRAASGNGSALAGAWYDLGLVLFRLRRYPQALGALQAALSARPDFQAARRAIDRVAGFLPRAARAMPRRLLPPVLARPARPPEA
ncbi:tetratricopeptide repeat protein [Accumulibacter sp.]|uniref:tetratricopeptide repeat protein n=1 Tax=Accumulibacter sp. TaxID=2053492 RepID=UPI0028C3E2C1|nr:tetratricopeptide repeat protein [Accumulibacter sp.]